MQIDITILLPVRNGGAFVEQAIESILMQCFDSYKLIVSNNKSTDDTAAIIEKFANNPKITVVNQVDDLDMFDHFNRCLEYVDTKYFMMLHHDDVFFDSSALKRAHEVMESDASISSVYSDMVYLDRYGKIISCRKFSRPTLVDGNVIAKASVIKTRNLFGIPLLVRSEAVCKSNFDNRITYAADLDFSIAVSRNRIFYHFPLPLIGYRIHGMNATFELFWKALGQMRLIAKKNQIDLNVLDVVRMFANSVIVAVQKWAFFLYVNYIRA